MSRRLLGQVKNFIKIKDYEVTVSKKSNKPDEIDSFANAILEINGKEIKNAREKEMDLLMH